MCGENLSIVVSKVSNLRPLDRFNARRSIELRLVIC